MIPYFVVVLLLRKSQGSVVLDGIGMKFNTIVFSSKYVRID